MDVEPFRSGIKWHHIFTLTCLKHTVMPNQGNKGNGTSHSGQGQTGDPNLKTSAPKENPERSDIKHGDHEKHHEGDTSRSSNQGRKEASGGSAEE